MGKKPKIVFIARHHCMRVVKIAIVLLDKGYDVYLITEKATQYSEIYNTVSLWPSIEHLYQTIKLHKDADLFHVHNEPSFFVSAVKDMLPDMPVILDVHDSMLLRRTDEEVNKAQDEQVYRYTIDERNNIQLADGLVFVCNPMKEMVTETYSTTQPNIVLYSMVPRMFYRIDFSQWIGGLVYEGRVDLPAKLTREWDFFKYTDYLPFAAKCRELGIDFHLYCPRENKDVVEAYQKACFFHEPQKYDKLIRKIGSHDWGLVGNLELTSEWNLAMPNKLFEYIAGCTPVVAMNAGESSKLIEEYGLGITVNSLEELTERWGEHREKRKTVIRNRFALSMDENIWKLEELYGKFL
jgi:glycosyltransferase involved in cell wall biosynthesis